MPGYIGRTEIQIAGGAISRNAFVGNGATTSFGPLDQTPFDEAETIVTINGVVQHDSSYAVVVDYVNFADVPANLDEIEVKVHSTERIPAAGASTENIQDEAVTLSKLSTVDLLVENNGTRFHKNIIPGQKIWVTGGVNGVYGTANRDFFEGSIIKYLDPSTNFTIDIAGSGDQIGVINDDINLTIIAGTGMTVHVIDANGTKTTLSAAQTYSIPDSKHSIRVNYIGPTEVTAETTYAPPVLKQKVMEIGDWDMDADATLTLAHGLTAANIRYYQAWIRDDNDNGGTPLNRSFGLTNGDVQGFINSVSGGANFILSRLTSGMFDSVNYDSTSFNRGWVTIWYV